MLLRSFSPLPSPRHPDCELINAESQQERETRKRVSTQIRAVNRRDVTWLPQQIQDGRPHCTGVAVTTSCILPLESRESDVNTTVGLSIGTSTTACHLFCRMIGS